MPLPGKKRANYLAPQDSEPDQFDPKKSPGNKEPSQPGVKNSLDDIQMSFGYILGQNDFTANPEDTAEAKDEPNVLRQSAFLDSFDHILETSPEHQETENEEKSIRREDFTRDGYFHHDPDEKNSPQNKVTVTVTGHSSDQNILKTSPEHQETENEETPIRGEDFTRHGFFHHVPDEKNSPQNKVTLTVTGHSSDQNISETSPEHQEKPIKEDDSRHGFFHHVHDEKNSPKKKVTVTGHN